MNAPSTCERNAASCLLNCLVKLVETHCLPKRIVLSLSWTLSRMLSVLLKILKRVLTHICHHPHRDNLIYSGAHKIFLLFSQAWRSQVSCICCGYVIRADWCTFRYQSVLVVGSTNVDIWMKARGGSMHIENQDTAGCVTDAQHVVVQCWLSNVSALPTPGWHLCSARCKQWS